MPSGWLRVARHRLGRVPGHGGDPFEHEQHHIYIWPAARFRPKLRRRGQRPPERISVDGGVGLKECALNVSQGTT